MTQSLYYSDKTLITLVKFSWGGQQVLLTDAGADINTPIGGGQPFIADPGLTIDYGTRKGGSEDGLTKISISRDLSNFPDNISSGRAHAPVEVIVYEFSSAQDNVELKQGWNFPFTGKVVRARRNPGGAQGLVELECSPWKNRLQGRAGIQCNAECANPFGGKLCGVPVDDHTEAGLITGVFRNRVTVSGLTSQPRRHWRRGYVTRNGLSIQIRDTDGQDTFNLAKIPPIEWRESSILGQASCVVRPGCDLLYGTCGDIWNNTSQFNGVGFASPLYNPVIENPGF